MCANSFTVPATVALAQPLAQEMATMLEDLLAGAVPLSTTERAYLAGALAAMDSLPKATATAIDSGQ